MKQKENMRLSRWLQPAMIILLTMSVARVTSQVTDRNSTRMKYYCSLYPGVNANYFYSNLNATLSSLRRQLTTGGYATARTLFNGESVWGMAWCRGYVSIPDCLDCFDYAVTDLKPCGLGNGAHVIYSDCDVRYENGNFYTEANNRAGVVNCDTGNDTSAHQSEYRKALESLLLDLQIAAPRAPKYYVASTRKVAVGNETVYAIGQCNLNVSQSVCLECLQLRSASLYDCLPKTGGRAMDNGCFMRYSRTPFFGQNQIIDISPLLWHEHSTKKWAIIAGVVGGVSFLLLLLAVFLWFSRSKKEARGQHDKSTGSTELLQGPSSYSYDDLKVATNNFSDENKLGGGMYGEVYKGTFKGGDAVAIKKTFMANSKRKTNFSNELKIIGNVHHRHLVRLLGYCTKGPNLFLVHEYLENRSLDEFLYGDKTRTLTWKQRFDIIFGTAKGLAYLHEQYHFTIIHRDIKTSNILLDNELQPKIADFGLMRLLPDDKTHLSTELAGSMNSGYVAPEYAIHGQLSVKVDTYSFGIVVLEILSGKRYKEFKGVDENSVSQNLLDHAWNFYENGTHLNLMDEKLDPNEYAPEDAKKIIEIALMCAQVKVSARPAMSEVVTLLSDKSVEERPPIRSTDEVKIQVTPLDSSTSSGATASTVQQSGR